MGVVAKKFIGAVSIKFSDGTILRAPIDSGLFYNSKLWKHEGERPVSITIPMCHILDTEFIKTIKFRMYPIKNTIVFLEDNRGYMK